MHELVISTGLNFTACWGALYLWHKHSGCPLCDGSLLGIYEELSDHVPNPLWSFLCWSINKSL